MKRLKTSGLTPVILGVSLITATLGTLHDNKVHAADADAWIHYNQTAVQQHIIPRYQTLASESAALDSAVATLCQAPSDANFAKAQTQFRSAMHAWQGIQHVQFGPVQFLMRNYSFEYWPDKKNIGQRQLNTALNMPSDSAYGEEFFHQASIALKGFPALERLLFNDNAEQKFADNPQRCRLTQAIAHYVAGMSSDIVNEWQNSATAPATDVIDEESDSPIPDFSIDLMKALVEPIEMIRDTKLRNVMGQSREEARSRRAESWRSEQSLANIKANVNAAHELYALPGGLAELLHDAKHDDDANAINAAFESVEKQLAELPDSLVSMLDSDQHYAQLQTLAANLKTLDSALLQAMSDLDIQLGFNSRDGD